MKNATLFLVLILTFSVFVSCSKDNNSENQLVIKKVTEEVFYSNSSDVSIQTFIYENNKFIKSIGSDGKYVCFVYDGDKITKTNRFSANNEFLKSTNLTYDGANLVKVESDNGESRSVFFYQNGKLSRQEAGYIINSEYAPSAKLEYSFDGNNNLVQVLNTSYYQNVTTSKSVYTYDDKNNPTKNMNKYLRLIFSTEGINGLSENNRVSQDSYFPISNTTPDKYKYEYIFNNDNYPTTIKRLTQSGRLISNTTIEYQIN